MPTPSCCGVCILVSVSLCPCPMSLCPCRAWGAGNSMAHPWGSCHQGDGHQMGVGQPWWLGHRCSLLHSFVFWGVFQLQGQQSTELGCTKGQQWGHSAVHPCVGWEPCPCCHLPILTHLQVLCGSPRCTQAIIAQLQRCSSRAACSKIANSLF